jgi:DNA-directed RNA polymerase subunit F
MFAYIICVAVQVLKDKKVKKIEDEAKKIEDEEERIRQDRHWRLVRSLESKDPERIKEVIDEILEKNKYFRSDQSPL